MSDDGCQFGQLSIAKLIDCVDHREALLFSVLG
jgi:hypothetical protein